MTPENPDNGKEQMEFREWWIGKAKSGFYRWLSAKDPAREECPSVFINADGDDQCVEYIHVVEIAKVHKLEERLLEATKWADTYQKKYELSYEKIARLESENKILREGPEKEAKWNKGSYSSERLLDVLDKADALRSEGKSE